MSLECLRGTAVPSCRFCQSIRGLLASGRIGSGRQKRLLLLTAAALAVAVGARLLSDARPRSLRTLLRTRCLGVRRGRLSFQPSSFQRFPRTRLRGLIRRQIPSSAPNLRTNLQGPGLRRSTDFAKASRSRSTSSFSIQNSIRTEKRDRKVTPIRRTS
jgi:hypothetical protein